MTGIVYIKRFTGALINLIQINTTDTTATATGAGYITAQAANIYNLNDGPFQWLPGDVVLLEASDGASWCSVNYPAATLTAIAGVGIAAVTYSGAITAGHIPKFSGIGGNIVDSGATPSNASDPYFVMSPGSLTIGNLAIFGDANGTVTQNAAALNNVANASATPGTIRSIFGEITSSVTTQTSGNLVGVRGAVNMVGASGGFIYGTQGKVIATGTLSGSEWTAGVFGQLDISAATINGGQAAPIWADYGATSGTLTNQTGLYGIAMTNTTAAVLAGQLYLYGGATTLMLLETNSGLSGVTYFQTSGTSAGSWGNATPPTPSKVLTISVDGTLYYLPLVAQNT